MRKKVKKRQAKIAKVGVEKTTTYASVYAARLARQVAAEVGPLRQASTTVRRKKKR
jgi:hypothetical protein